MYANKNNDMAVSPIVATLVLIVVAVIGAVAVGTIMGTFSTDVSKQASSQQAGSAAHTEILVAGSTTLIPAELNLQTDYQRLNPGIQINVQGGGSSAGPQSVAMGIADIGATSSASAITSAVTNNAADPNYANLYFTQIGGRGVVFIQDASQAAVPTNVVDKADLNTAYLDASGHSGKTSADTTGVGYVIKTNTAMLQREAGSGTMGTAFTYIGGATKANQSTGYTGLTTEQSNAQMLAAVQAGTASAPVVGFVDSGFAITGGVSSNTTANGISIMGVYDGTNTYVPTHANIKSALKDWYYGNAQGTNYPQGLVGGLYWLTKGNSPSAFTANKITTVGISSASSDVTALINFAKSPTEAAAFNNAGMYSMYDFL
jgi:phosphate transport system substrate-binding protein